MSTEDITNRMSLHGYDIVIPNREFKILKDCYFTLDGNYIYGTVWYKSHFDKVLATFNKLGLDIEFAGSFRVGVYIKTVGWFR